MTEWLTLRVHITTIFLASVHATFLRLVRFASAYPANNFMKTREEVKWFCAQMEAKLQKNDHKGGWSDCRFDWLFQRLDEELDELRRAEMPVGLNTAREKMSEQDAHRIISECADIANFSMMIADNVRKRAFDKI